MHRLAPIPVFVCVCVCVFVCVCVCVCVYEYILFFSGESACTDSALLFTLRRRSVYELARVSESGYEIKFSGSGLAR